MVVEDTRNVIDFYKYWTTDAIKADLDTKRHNFGVLTCNINGDFNIGSVIRNANAFLAREVILYGNKKYDKRGAVGTHNYLDFKHVAATDILPAYPIIAIDNVPGAVPIEDFVWPTDYFLMAFGEEQYGLPQTILDNSRNVVYISQYGSVRSLNVGCASGVAMYDYVSKMKHLELVKESNCRNYGQHQAT